MFQSGYKTNQVWQWMDGSTGTAESISVECGYSTGTLRVQYGNSEGTVRVEWHLSGVTGGSIAYALSSLICSVAGTSYHSRTGYYLRAG